MDAQAYGPDRRLQGGTHIARTGLRVRIRGWLVQRPVRDTAHLHWVGSEKPSLSAPRQPLRDAFTALKLACWLNTMERRLFSLPYETKDCHEKIEYFLPCFSKVLQVHSEPTPLQSSSVEDTCAHHHDDTLTASQ